MPRNTDPNDIIIGSGRAGQGSVTASSLNFTPGNNSGLLPDVEARDVVSEEPPLLGGENVQTNLNVINELAPLPRPNRLDEASNPLNLPALTYTPEPQLGRYPDGTALGTVARVINEDDLVISGILYPADRGVLAIKLDGTVVQAINLSSAFTEGEPEDTAAPARVVGQNDLTAPGAGVAVDGLPVNITLVDRLPQLTEYERASFPFLAAGVDPVYEAFGTNYAGYQLARFEATVSMGVASALLGVLQIVHYRTEDDYFADKASDPFETFAVVTPYADPLYRDADVATNVLAASFSVAPVDVADTAEATPRVVSGVTYYGNVDTYDVIFEATGVYADTFTEEAIKYRFNPGSDVGAQTVDYTEYSPSPILTGSASTFTDVAEVFEPDAGEFAFIARPELAVRDPFGRLDTDAGPTTRILFNTATTFYEPGDTPPVLRVTTENFLDEATRYDVSDIDLVALDPRGLTSSFDNTASLGATDLIVQGIPPEHALPSGVSGLGGELSYPNTNFSVGHVPNLPGGVNQPDYSALTGNRSYFRAFGLTRPTKAFQFRVVGNPTAGAANLAEDLLITDREGYSPSGVALSFLSGAKYNAVGLPLELGGAMVSYTVESTYSVLFDVRLDNFPLYDAVSGYFSYILAVGIEDSSTAATGGDFALYKLELIEG